MNWNQINPNLQTLGQLISKSDFVFWFFSMNSDVITNVPSGMSTNTGMLTFFGNGGGLGTNAGLYANWPRLCDVLRLRIGALTDINKFSVKNELSNFLGTIYDLFKNAIPYNQTTTSQSFITASPYQISDVSNYVVSTANIPAVLNEISAYLDLYINEIIQYVILTYKYFVEGKVLSQGLTNQLTENESSGRSGQNAGYHGNTFNPVSSKFNPVVSPMPISNQLVPANTRVNNLPQGADPNNPNNPSTAEPLSNKQGIQFTSLDNLANANVNSNSFTNNETLNRTHSNLNLSELKDIGTTQTLTTLKPLIYKISTLFWTLGNDNYPHDDINWGFNIW